MTTAPPAPGGPAPAAAAVPPPATTWQQRLGTVVLAVRGGLSLLGGTAPLTLGEALTQIEADLSRAAWPDQVVADLLSASQAAQVQHQQLLLQFLPLLTMAPAAGAAPLPPQVLQKQLAQLGALSAAAVDLAAQAQVRSQSWQALLGYLVHRALPLIETLASLGLDLLAHT